MKVFAKLPFTFLNFYVFIGSLHKHFLDHLYYLDPLENSKYSQIQQPVSTSSKHWDFTFLPSVIIVVITFFYGNVYNVYLSTGQWPSKLEDLTQSPMPMLHQIAHPAVWPQLDVAYLIYVLFAIAIYLVLLRNPFPADLRGKNAMIKNIYSNGKTSIKEGGVLVFSERGTELMHFSESNFIKVNI